MIDDERDTAHESEPVAEQPAGGAPSPAAAPAERAAVPPIVLSPPSIFQDRELTPVEAKRQAMARVQPKPWEPPADLDPSSDEGWDRAAAHELIAVRPEDVAAPPAFAAGGAAATIAAGSLDASSPVAAQPADPRHALPVADPSAAQRYLAPTTSALAWSKGGAAGGSPSAGAATTGAATTPTPAFTPFGAATQSPFLTPLPSGGQSAVAGATAPSPIAIPPEAAAVAVATGAAHRRPWTGAGSGIRGSARSAARPALVVVLFGMGILLGSTVYGRSQPAPVAAVQTPQATAEPGVTTTVPPQIQSLIAALNADDQSQIQLVVPATPFRLLAGELASDGIVKVVGAKAMSTYVQGQDSATEILIAGADDQGNTSIHNLVVHMHDGQISDFR